MKGEQVAEDQTIQQKLVEAATPSGSPFEMKVLTPELLLSFIEEGKHLGPIALVSFWMANIGNFRAMRIALMGRTAAEEKPDQLFYLAMTPDFVTVMTEVMAGWVR